MKRDYQTYTLKPIMKDDDTEKEHLDQPNLILFVVIVVCAILFWV